VTRVFSIRSSALSPTARYRVLAALTALGAVQCAAFAVWPPDPATPSTALLVAAALLAVAALGVWLVLPRGSAWLIDAWVAILAIAICAAGYAGASASNQLAAALGLALLAVYCAYFLPLGRMLFQVVWMIGLFVALTVASPQLDSLLYTAIVVVTLVALVWMVSQLASLLAAAAVRDPLTGILNRRGLVEAAELVRAVILRADRRISSEGVIVIKAQQHRSLEQNRTEAMQRLMALVQAAQRVPRLRRATTPTHASKQRRLQGKALRGQLKALRGGQGGVD